MAAVRDYPLRGELRQFYAGGFGGADEDCRRLLRQMARWSQQRQPEGTVIEAVTASLVRMDEPEEDGPVTWAGAMLITPWGES